MKLRSVSIVTAVGVLLSAANALASPGLNKDSIGQPGDSLVVDRTIEVRMGDIFFELLWLNDSGHPDRALSFAQQ